MYLHFLPPTLGPPNKSKKITISPIKIEIIKNCRDANFSSPAATAIASGLSTLIERNRNGAVVRSFSLSQATSNTSVGVYWDVFYGRNDDETLYWQELNTTISGTRPSGTFHFSISLINFASAIRGRIDVANMAITPRSIETAIKISDYQYLDATNTLSIRVFSAYGTNNYKVERGQISSGTAIDRVYFAIDETAQRLPNNTAISGTPLPVSISAWQILPGLRTPIAQSFTGNLLTDRYGASWDVLYSDITLPAPNSLDPQHSLLSLSMGNGATPSNATGPSAPGAPSSAPHLYPASCILLLALLLSLFL